MGREDSPLQNNREKINDGDGTEGVSTRRFEEAFDLVERIKQLNEKNAASEKH